MMLFVEDEMLLRLLFKQSTIRKKKTDKRKKKSKNFRIKNCSVKLCMNNKDQIGSGCTNKLYKKKNKSKEKGEIQSDFVYQQIFVLNFLNN